MGGDVGTAFKQVVTLGGHGQDVRAEGRQKFLFKIQEAGSEEELQELAEMLDKQDLTTGQFKEAADLLAARRKALGEMEFAGRAMTSNTTPLFEQLSKSQAQLRNPQGPEILPTKRNFLGGRREIGRMGKLF